MIAALSGSIDLRGVGALIEYSQLPLLPPPDCGVYARHIANELKDLQHGRTASDMIVELRLVIELLPQMVELCAIVQQDDGPF